MPTARLPVNILSTDDRDLPEIHAAPFPDPDRIWRDHERADRYPPPAAGEERPRARPGAGGRRNLHMDRLHDLRRHAAALEPRLVDPPSHLRLRRPSRSHRPLD